MTYSLQTVPDYLECVSRIRPGTRSSAVAERPRDDSCHGIFHYVTQGHSKSFEEVVPCSVCYAIVLLAIANHVLFTTDCCVDYLICFPQWLLSFYTFTT